MAKLALAHLLALATIVLCLAAPAPTNGARKENVKYIRCAVCNELSKQLMLQVSKKRESLSPKKITEFDIIEIAENLCNIKKEESEWMFYLDIVQEGNKAKLVDHEEEGECGTKCKTIARTCQEVIGDFDTDISEYIYKNLNGLSENGISEALCKDLSRACSKQVVVPKNVDFGEAFMPKSSKDADISKLMRSMSGMPGAPGMKMYSKDDLANMKNFGVEGDGDEDDEDEDEAPLQFSPPKLRRATKPGPTEKLMAFLPRMQQVFTEAKQQAVQFYGMGLKKLRQFWRGRFDRRGEL